MKAASTSFGRRQPAVPGRSSAPARVVAAPPAGDLSPEAQAVVTQLAAEPRRSASGFADWRRSQVRERLVYWGLTLAFLSPGLLCFAFNAPAGVSTLMEIAGLGVGVWLRLQRRRRLRQIVAWDETPAEL